MHPKNVKHSQNKFLIVVEIITDYIQYWKNLIWSGIQENKRLLPINKNIPISKIDTEMIEIIKSYWKESETVFLVTFRYSKMWQNKTGRGE